MSEESNKCPTVAPPAFPGDETATDAATVPSASDVPAPFRKLHRRSGERFGLYLAETKNRFVVSDGQREVLGLWALLVTVALMLVFLLIAKAYELLGLFVVGGCLLPLVVVEVFFMKRLTTTFDRRSRRVVQVTTTRLCWRSRNEVDLDDVVRVVRRGLGRPAVMVAELSSGEELPLTYPGLTANEDLKSNGPNRLNNFLLRVRGQAGRKFPPSYVVARGARTGDSPSELSFEANDVIRVLAAASEVPGGGGWWRGKLANGSVGYFPPNYTVEMTPSELAASAANQSQSQSN